MRNHWKTANGYFLYRAQCLHAKQESVELCFDVWGELAGRRDLSAGLGETELLPAADDEGQATGNGIPGSTRTRRSLHE